MPWRSFIFSSEVFKWAITNSLYLFSCFKNCNTFYVLQNTHTRARFKKKWGRVFHYAIHTRLVDFGFLLNIHYRNSFFYWLVWSWHELVTIFILGYRMLTVKRTEMEDLENVILYIYMNLLHRTHILKKKIFFHVVASKLQYFLRIEDIRWIVKRVPAKGK